MTLWLCQGQKRAKKLYLFCISKSKIGVESGLTGFVCSDWRCNDSASRMQSKLALDCWGAACLSESKVTAVFGSFQQISCFSPRVVMTPTRFAWHPLEHLSYVSCEGEKKCEKHAEQRFNDGAFSFCLFHPSASASVPFRLQNYYIPTTHFIPIHLNSSQFIHFNPN